MPSDIFPTTQRSPRLRVLVAGSASVDVIGARVSTSNYFGAGSFSFQASCIAPGSLSLGDWSSIGTSDLTVEVAITQDDDFTTLISGRADAVTIDPVNYLVEVTGRDYSAVLIDANNQDSFINQTSSQVISTLAARHGLTAQVTPTTDIIGRQDQSGRDYMSLHQYSSLLSDWDVATELARREGYDLFVVGTTLFFQDSAASGLNLVSLRPADLISLRLRRDLTVSDDTEVIIKSWNSQDQAAILERAAAMPADSSASALGTRQHIVTLPNLTRPDAANLALRRLNEIMSQRWSIELEMPGDTLLTTRHRIDLRGTQTDFDHTYEVECIDRRFHPVSGYSQFVRAHGGAPGIIR